MTTQEILAQVAAGTLDPAEAVKLIKTETEKPVGELYMKVGNKGGAGLYGINSRLPVTLYVEQWERLIEYVKSGKAEKFLTDNAASLVRKDDSETVKASKAKTPARLAAAQKAVEYAVKESAKAKA